MKHFRSWDLMLLFSVPYFTHFSFMCFAFLAASNTTTINSDNSDNNNDNKTPLLDYRKNQAKVVLKGGGGAWLEISIL